VNRGSGRNSVAIVLDPLNIATETSVCSITVVVDIGNRYCRAVQVSVDATVNNGTNDVPWHGIGVGKLSCIENQRSVGTDTPAANGTCVMNTTAGIRD
jgi:hypothetical protein